MRKKIPGIIFLTLSLALGAECRAQQKSLSQTSSWAYQLQQADPSQLAACKYDVIVMDYSKDGTDAGAYTPAEIKSIRDKGKIVLAYLSIGEAENYRFYWQSGWRPGDCQPGDPAWLGPPNPDWPGNYKVRYWYSGWWTTCLQPYLDRILKAGFDGVYLDIIDAYYFWLEHCPSQFSLPATADQMVALVEKIGNYTRASHPGFILCPQNGESIIDDVSATSVRDRYFKAINAIGVEDLFYHYGTHEDQVYRFQILRQYRQAGKKVFNIEYLGRTWWNQYLNLVCDANLQIIPYAGLPDRALDELIPDFPQLNCVNPGVLMMLLD